MKLFSQSLMLISSFIIVFLWQISPLADFTVPALGFLIFIYLILSKGKPTNLEKDDSDKKPRLAKEDLNIFILNSIILLLIFTTGGLESPLYFLLYFISFGITFVLLPETVFVFILGAILIFLPEAIVGETSRNFIQIGSLALISPLAFFFGREYKAKQLIAERDKEIGERITEQAGSVLQQKENVLTPEEKKDLAEIIRDGQELKNENL